MSRNSEQEIENRRAEIKRAEKKKFIITVSAFTALCAIATGALLFTGGENESSDQPVSVSEKLTDEDRDQIRLLTDQFVTAAGHIGLKTEAFNPADTLNIQAFVTSGSSMADTYWDSRSQVYSDVQASLLAKDSPLWYPSSDWRMWDDEEERVFLMSARSSVLDVKVPDNSSRMSYQGSAVQTVTTDFTLISKISTRVKDRNDSSWDGTYSVLEGSFREPAKMQVVKTNGEWKVYNITGGNPPYFLATWGNPGGKDNAGYYDALSNVKKVSTFKVKLTPIETS